jgi:hypothetical protein
LINARNASKGFIPEAYTGITWAVFFGRNPRVLVVVPYIRKNCVDLPVRGYPLSIAKVKAVLA